MNGWMDGRIVARKFLRGNFPEDFSQWEVLQQQFPRRSVSQNNSVPEDQFPRRTFSKTTVSPEGSLAEVSFLLKKHIFPTLHCFYLIIYLSIYLSGCLFNNLVFQVLDHENIWYIKNPIFFENSQTSYQ